MNGFLIDEKAKKYPIVRPVGFDTYTCAFREFPAEYGGVLMSFRQETGKFLFHSRDGKSQLQCIIFLLR